MILINLLKLENKCSEKGCSRPRRDKSGTLCDMHRKRDRKIKAAASGEKCHIDDNGLPCGKPIMSPRLKLCSVHSSRLWKYGDVNWQPHRPGWLNEAGYKNISVNGKVYLEHRFLVEQLIGRALLKTEYVHHRNGDKIDNTVGQCLGNHTCDCVDGPHNLELWAKSQPKGQRVIDIVNDALELLRRYNVDIGVAISQPRGSVRLNLKKKRSRTDPKDEIQLSLSVG